MVEEFDHKSKLVTNRQMDRPTDKPSYRDARTHQKSPNIGGYVSDQFVRYFPILSLFQRNFRIPIEKDNIYVFSYSFLVVYLPRLFVFFLLCFQHVNKNYRIYRCSCVNTSGAVKLSVGSLILSSNPIQFNSTRKTFLRHLLFRILLFW